jgi:predicted nucleotide-binding protein
MKIDEIIDNLIDGSISIEKALQRTRVHAIKTGDMNLKQWIDHEINGYEDKDELPAYRKSSSGFLRYSGINGSYQVTDTPLDLSWFDANIKRAIQEDVVRDGIDIVEDMIKTDSEIIKDMTTLAGVVSSKSNGAIKCTSIRKYIPKSIFQKVCAEVKSILIEALIKIQKKNNEGEQAGAKIEETTEQVKINENVFIIHGHNELLRRELCDLLRREFNLNPIVLVDQPAEGLITFLEKFEKHAKQCCFAFALFTPDDIVSNKTEQYFQVRPNVIFELGWFTSYFSRRNVCILNKMGSGTEIFTDLQGIERIEFKDNLAEVFIKIRNELRSAGLIK